MSLNTPNDSYVNIEEANNYHRLRVSFEAWDGLGEKDKARRLVSASDFLDHYYHFVGEKAEPHQSRQFPRKTDSRITATPTIPQAVKFAVCELALQSDLNQNTPQMMSSVKVGPISVNYSEGQTDTANRFEYVKSLLGDWIEQPKGYVELLRG